MMDISHLGERIRERRKKKMMTIKVLSEYTGVSAGHLSMLEQNKATPNIENLIRICEVLNISIAEILEEKRPGKSIIRKEEIREKQYPDENMTVGIIDFKQENNCLEYITILPGEAAKREEYRHVFPETCTVISGVLTIDIEGIIYVLNPGDSAYIKAGERHCIYNTGDEKTVSLWSYQRIVEGNG